MTTEEWFDKAIAYFNGTMTTEQSQLFEKETAASEELSELMQLWKTTDADAALYEQYREDAEKLLATHQRLKADFVNGQNKSGKFKISPWRWVAIAAAVTGIIIVMKFFTPSSQNDSPVAEHKVNTDSLKKTVLLDSVRKIIEVQTLYADNFTPDKIPEDPNGPLDDAFFYYGSGQYNQAITAIDRSKKKALTRGAGADTSLTKFYAVYYKALSLLSIGNGTEALPLLKESVSLAPTALMKAKAQWYLSLGYLKQENVPSAKESLQILIKNNSAGIYKTKAEKLLVALNK